MAKTATTKTAAPAEPHTCACGCGEPVARTFKQGHDQRLISRLASDLVHADVWRGTCMGILKLKDVRRDQQDKIDTVSAYVSEKLSEPLGAKVYNAAMRQWELQKNADERAAAKAERAKANADKPKRESKKGTAKPAAPSEEAGVAAPAEPKLITRAAASNDDVDAAEAALGNGQPSPGAVVRVKVGKARPREATVHGMNQAGKVTAVRYKVGKNEIIKTEGQFEIV